MPAIDLSGAINSSYQKAHRKAKDAERRGAAAEAAASHRQCAELMRQYAQYAEDVGVRKQREKMAAAHEEMAQSLVRGGISPVASKRKDVQPEGVSGEDNYEDEILALREKTDVSWEDIGGLESTKESIKLAYGLALVKKPAGVKIDSWRNFLLFGPPGTGKTLLAAATAGTLDATFFNVKVSNLLSKYFGESTKLISALFSVARRCSPAVVFLDEFESLSPPRNSEQSGAEGKIISTLLTELDGLSTISDNRLVLTVGATNVPWMIDSAILSRFENRIYVPLPDSPARKQILELNLVKKGIHTKVSLDDLTRRTDGYSGREIKQLCQAAIASMAKRANPDLLKWVDEGAQKLDRREMEVVALSESDFREAFTRVQARTSAAQLRKYDEWIHRVND